MKTWKELFEEGEALDLNQIMKRIDEKLPSEQKPLPSAESSPSGPSWPMTEQDHELRRELDEANVNWNISQYSMRSSRSGILGWVLTLYKGTLDKLLRPMLNVILFRQAHLNSNFVRILNILERRLYAAEYRARQMETLEKKYSEQHERLKAELSKLITERTAELQDIVVRQQTQMDRIGLAQENLTNAVQTMREEMESLVDEIAARLDQENRLRQALRRQLTLQLHEELNRVEQQMNEALVREVIGEALWGELTPGDLEQSDKGDPGA